MKKRAFTVIEILLALGIVGAIAALTIPSLMNDVNKRTLTSQLKNIVNDITYLSDEQLLNNSTKDIQNTDFKDRNLFYRHFAGSTACSDTNPCWADTYKKITKMENATYTIPSNATSIKLKNGAALYYTYGELPNEFLAANPLKYKLIPTFAMTYEKFLASRGGGPVTVPSSPVEAKKYGLIIIDINSTDAPNIIGRDLFEFRISESGHLPEPSLSNLELYKVSCQGGSPANCFKYLQANNWNMDY